MPKKLEGKIALVTGRNPLQKNTVYSSLTAFTWVRNPLRDLECDRHATAWEH